MKKIFLVFSFLFAVISNLFSEDIPISAKKLEILNEGNLWVGIGEVSLSWEEWQINADELVLDYLSKKIIDSFLTYHKKKREKYKNNKNVTKIFDLNSKFIDIFDKEKYYSDIHKFVLYIHQKIYEIFYYLFYTYHQRILQKKLNYLKTFLIL